MVTANPICLQLERQAVCRALSRAWAKNGKRIAARIALMAMTTSSSMRVNARCMTLLFMMAPPFRGQKTAALCGNGLRPPGSYTQTALMLSLLILLLRAAWRVGATFMREQPLGLAVGWRGAPRGVGFAGVRSPGPHAEGPATRSGGPH